MMLEFWVKSDDETNFVWWIASASSTGPATPSAPRHGDRSGGQSGPVVIQYGRGRRWAQGYEPFFSAQTKNGTYADSLWSPDTRQKNTPGKVLRCP
eukprot:gene24938-biopygen8974